MLVHHYTTETVHLPKILESGVLLPSNAGAPNEPPLLWFSKAQRWEHTATKMVGDGSGGRRLLTLAEQLSTFGCVRFSLAADDPRLMSWSDACRLAGITSTAKRKLEVLGKKRGGSPIDWFAIEGSVPLSELGFQRYDGVSWA